MCKELIITDKSSISSISNIQERSISVTLRSTNPWDPRYPISKVGVYLMSAKSYPQYPQYPTSLRGVYQGIFSQQILSIQYIQYPRVVSVSLMCAKSWSSQINPQYPQYPTSRRGVFQWLFGQQIIGIQDIQYPRLECAWCVKRVDRLDKSSISLISNIQERCISENLWSTNLWYPRYPISKVGMYLMSRYVPLWSNEKYIFIFYFLWFTP